MDNKKEEVVTLNQLINEKKGQDNNAAPKAAKPIITKPLSEENVKTVDIGKLKKDIDTTGPEENQTLSVNKMMSDLDAAMERKKKDFKARADAAKAEIMEKCMNGELQITTDGNVVQTKPNEKAPTPTKVEKVEAPTKEEDISVTLNTDDIKDDEVEDSGDINDMIKELENSDEVLDDDEVNQLVRDNATRKDGEQLSKAIINTLKPKIKAVLLKNNDEIDFSKFKVATRTVAYSKVLSIIPDNTNQYTSTWVLPNTGRSITMREFTGSEIEILSAAYSTNSNINNRINALKRMYALIYNHIVDSNKPATMEEWLKTVSYLDMAHLSFAIYKASFETTNYLPYVCTNSKCHQADLVHVDIEQMVEYKDEDTKKRFQAILQKDSTSNGGQVEEHLVQISNEFAAGLIVPSIYTLVFENIVLDEAFREKYSQVLGYLSFINNIYKIDKENHELIAIDTKPDRNDFKKTVRNKIIIYTKILNQLSSDDYSKFTLAIDQFSNKKTDSFDVKYVTPAHTCEKCKTEIEKSEIDPMNLVFLRHRLIREVD